jgi:hypothetical protein
MGRLRVHQSVRRGGPEPYINVALAVETHDKTAQFWANSLTHALKAPSWQLQRGMPGGDHLASFDDSLMMKCSEIRCRQER